MWGLAGAAGWTKHVARLRGDECDGCGPGIGEFGGERDGGQRVGKEFGVDRRQEGTDGRCTHRGCW